jgi:hypothetical protein
MRLPYLRAHEEFITEIECGEYWKINVWRFGMVSKGIGGSWRLDNVHAVKKSEALNFQNTSKPLIREKMIVQNIPQYARYGCVYRVRTAMCDFTRGGEYDELGVDCCRHSASCRSPVLSGLCLQVRRFNRETSGIRKCFPRKKT